MGHYQLNLIQTTYHSKHGLKQVLSDVDMQHCLRHSNWHVFVLIFLKEMLACRVFKFSSMKAPKNASN